MDWPDHYPPQCPPRDAEDAAQTVYRFLNRRTPKARDFESHYERDLKKVDLGHQDSPRSWGHLECKSRGLSVYTDISHCREAKELVPSMRKKSVGEFTLEPSDHAKLMKTPGGGHPEHHTVWLPSYSGLEGRCNLVTDDQLTGAGGSDA